MSFSYTTYENGNPENRANFTAITEIPPSVVDILKRVLVIDCGTTDHINSNQTSFRNYRTFETDRAIYTGRGTIYTYGMGVIELFAKQKKSLPRKITLDNMLHVPSSHYKSDLHIMSPTKRSILTSQYAYAPSHLQQSTVCSV